MKRKISKLFYRTGLGSLFRNLQSDHIFIFNYHRIRDNKFQTNFDESVFGPTESEFLDHLTWLKNNFQIWSEADFLNFKVQCQEIKKKSLRMQVKKELKNLIKGPVVAITFDDGYEDNYRLAFPILKKLQIPAIFFIPTQMIEMRQLSWWDHINYVVKKSPRTNFKFRGQKYFGGAKATQSAIKLMNKFEDLALTDDKFIAELVEVTQSQMPSIEEQSIQIMQWEQIIEMSQNGMSIGGHTHTHKILSRLELEEQESEILNSKQILENKLHKVIYSLAYPCGHYEQFNTETKVIAKTIGYNLAFSFLTGPQKLSKMDFYDIRRAWPQLDIERIDFLTSFPNFLIKNQSLVESPKSYLKNI
jgi:peptidoglycan/xylan/chitin deacetylase (PgdA/CDA1 family)